jgi:hypothetical protein
VLEVVFERVFEFVSVWGLAWAGRVREGVRGSVVGWELGGAGS